MGQKKKESWMEKTTGQRKGKRKELSEMREEAQGLVDA